MKSIANDCFDAQRNTPHEEYGWYAPRVYYHAGRGRCAALYERLATL